MSKKTLIILFIIILTVTIGLMTMAYLQDENIHAESAEGAVTRLGYYIAAVLLTLEEAFLFLDGLYVLSKRKSKSRTAFYIALPLIIPVLVFVILVL